MNKRIVIVSLVVLTAVMAGKVSAEVPAGVEPGAWAKVEAQLEAQGVRAGAKAGREVPGEVAKLLPTPYWKGDKANFGRAVAVDGDLMVVGAIDDDRGAEAGAAYVFGRNQGGTGAWGQVVKITASDGAEYDYFGYSVAISGDTVVVGAFGDDEGQLEAIFFLDVLK